MGTTYALLVGINAYLDNPLRGCVDDVRHALEFLRARVSDVHERVLLDAQATRGAVIHGFRDHLGRAGRDDVALFWFSGHGGEEPVPDEYWHVEPSGFLQTLVCVDSRHTVNGERVPDLVDKDVRILVEEVAAKGAHVVVVLDCCHSRGGTRDPDVALRGVGRAVEAPPVSSYLHRAREPTNRDAVGETEPSPHVELAACQSHEKAKEQRVDGMIRGVFSVALLGALQTLGPGATYRDLITAARSTVQNMADEQSPELDPVDLGGLADQPFLGGQVRRPAAFVLTHGKAGWQVDAGRFHSIPTPTTDDPLLFAVPAGDGDQATGLLRVVEVQTAWSLVEPLGWIPDQQRQYPVVVASLPMPLATVVVGGLPDDDAIAAALVERAIRSAGSGDGPSPHIRTASAAEPTTGLRIRVATRDEQGRSVFQILRGDGLRATADVKGHTEASARLLVARLEHIAQWTHLKELTNPASGLTGAVTIDVVAAEPGETVAPRDRPPMLPDEHGEIRLAYKRVGTDWQPPGVFIRLHNNSGRRLWCVLLDLTDRYRVHPKLFPGDFVGAGGVGAALQGRPIPVTLPRGREVRPGAEVRDWLKVIVAEERFTSLAFELPALDEPPTRSARTIRPRGLVDRIGLRATTRDVGDEPDFGAASDWATTILPVVAVAT